MFEDDYSVRNLNDKTDNNLKKDITDRYYNIDNNPNFQKKIKPKEKIFYFNYEDTNSEEDLDIELESVSRKIPITNNDKIDKEDRTIKLENNNKISPLQRKKRSKIHRHKSYDNLHSHKIINDKENNNEINYTKINNPKRNVLNIKITNDNMRRDFNEQNENINNKTDYDVYRGINKRQYDNEIDKNTIDVKINKDYFENNSNKLNLDNDQMEIIDSNNNKNKIYYGNSNLINLKAAHNNNYYINLGNNKKPNLFSKNEESDKNSIEIFNQSEYENTNIPKEENKYNDDESLVQKIENKLKNKFQENEVEDYFNRTPNIRNSSINYFENDFEGNDNEYKDKSPFINEIVFKPTNIINLEKKQKDNDNNYSKDKTQYNKLINQIKKLKEENKALKSRNAKLSEKILHIEKEQKKKNHNEQSLLQKIKKLENQINQKNSLIAKLTNRDNFNNIRKVKIISFLIRNKKNCFKYFENLKIRKTENIHFIPEYLKENEYEKENSDNSNIEENYDDEYNEGEFEEDEDININQNDNFEEYVETEKETIKNNKNISLKKNKSNKVFGSVINNIQNNYKRLSSNSNNNTININKIYYNNERYHHSLPVSNKKNSKINGKKSIYEFFEKSNNNNKDNTKVNNNKAKNIISKKSGNNKYNQNYNLNFYKNNCYNNNFISLFKKESDINNNKTDNNIIQDNINKQIDKKKTSLIMSVLSDNLLGNMNFNLANAKIESNRDKNKDDKNFNK